MSILEHPSIAQTSAAPAADIARAEPAADDVELDRLLLDIVGTKQDVEIQKACTRADLERTMEGASTLTIELYDRDHRLENSSVFDEAIDLEIDDMWYRLFTVKTSGYYVTLVFIDRDVAYLMQHDTPRRASRSKMTRLEFCLYLVRFVKKHKIPVVCPELHQKYAAKRPDTDDVIETRDASWKDRKRGQGFGRGADIKVKRVAATAAQKRAISTVLDEGLRQAAPEKLMIAAIMVITQESVAGKLRHGTIRLNRGPQSGPFQHIGLFHQDSKTGSAWRKLGGGTGNDEKDARAFFKAGKEVYDDNPKRPPHELCEAIQHSGVGSLLTYGQWTAEATNTVGAYQGEPDKQNERTVRQRYFFSTKDDSGKPENYWKAVGRLLAEVQVARFISNGTLYMISEKRLMKSRIRMKLSRKTPGVKDIDYDWNVNKSVARCTVTCTADRWIAPPGTVVQLVNCGPASQDQGRWLVSRISRSMFSKDTTIELKKPRPKLKEPAAEVVTVSRDLSDAEGGRLSGGGRIADMYRQGQAIHDKHYPYVWGGGHARCGHADRGDGSTPGIGYDCSGSTAAVVAAGLGGARDHISGGQLILRGQPVPASGWMASNYLAHGEGEFMTVWANGVHVWIEFKIKKVAGKRKSEHFGTGDWGKGWRGAGFNKNMHTKIGFTPRHLPGY